MTGKEDHGLLTPPLVEYSEEDIITLQPDSQPPPSPSRTHSTVYTFFLRSINFDGLGE